MRDTKRCSICKSDYYGWGNNAEPINSGQCCNQCNEERVIPTRMAQCGFTDDAISQAKEMSQDRLSKVMHPDNQQVQEYLDEEMDGKVGSIKCYKLESGNFILEIADFEAIYCMQIEYDSKGDEIEVLDELPEGIKLDYMWYFDSMDELDTFIDNRNFLKVGKI